VRDTFAMTPLNNGLDAQHQRKRECDKRRNKSTERFPRKPKKHPPLGKDRCYYAGSSRHASCCRHDPRCSAVDAVTMSGLAVQSSPDKIWQVLLSWLSRSFG
jgi:hypothetical protein